MKIFNGPKNSTGESSHAPKASGKEQSGIRKKFKSTIEKKDISDSEIREKLASKVELSNTAKMASIAKNVNKLGDSFMNPEALGKKLESKPITKSITKEEEKSDDPNTKDHIIKSDVQKNSPTDTDTTEKLKSVLTRGAFNFNPKEREALDRILSNK